MDANAPTTHAAARIEDGLREVHRLLPPTPARPDLRRWALRDPTSLLIFAVAFAAGIGRGQWPLAVAALLGEGLWLLCAPWIPAARRGLLARDAGDRAEREKERRAGVFSGLSAGDRARLEALLDLRLALADRATVASSAPGDALLAALAKVDVLLGLCALEARRAAELQEYLRELDPEQIDRDRRRLERQASAESESSTDAAGGADAGAPQPSAVAGLELIRQRQSRARAARAGLEASRTRIAELEGALRAAASAPGDGTVDPPLADLLAGVEAVVAATLPEAPAGSWNALMQRTP